MFNQILNWINNNKGWFFSGIGTSLLVIILKCPSWDNSDNREIILKFDDSDMNERITKIIKETSSEITEEEDFEENSISINQDSLLRAQAFSQIQTYAKDELGLLVFEYKSDKNNKKYLTQINNKLSKYLRDEAKILNNNDIFLHIDNVDFISINSPSFADSIGKAHNAQFVLWGDAVYLPTYEFKKIEDMEKYVLITNITMAKVIDYDNLIPVRDADLILEDNVDIGYENFEIIGELKDNFKQICYLIAGMVLLKEGKIDDSLSLFELAKTSQSKFGYVINCHIGKAYYQKALIAAGKVRKLKEIPGNNKEIRKQDLIFTTSLENAKKYIYDSLAGESYAYGNYFLGLVFYAEKDYLKAKEHFSKAVALKPNIARYRERLEFVNSLIQ